MSTTQRRGGSYIWVTWLTGLLSGDRRCTWAPWFKAHFKYDKVAAPSFDQAAWSSDHDDLVRRRVAELTADGWLVFVEDQNAFTLQGKVATLAGKPDIVAVRASDGDLNGDRLARVEDAKTGKPRHADFWQVLTYMLALPLTHEAVRGVSRLTGYVQYRDHVVTVQPEEFTPALRAKLIALIGLVGGPDSPTHAPSPRECGFCDIGPRDCTLRADRTRETVTSDLF